MAVSALATSSLKLDGVFLQLLQRDDLQRHSVGGLEHDLRGAAGSERLFPAVRTQAPAVAWLEAGEAVLAHRCREVVAVLLGESQELRRHDAANRVQPDIFATGVAAGIAVKA